ncbi:uncharacterized protein K02A2.6-like [Aedes albopictus]|uniref:RNA-directed DNA polymerase n=1 Tax=Aedes albopictus TaxID=7160 RepID=A0ABM1ZSL3_AEDAL
MYIHHLLEASIPEAVTLQTVAEETQNDPILQELVHALETNVWTEDVRLYKPFKAELHVAEGVVMRGDRLIIPGKLQNQVLDCAHDGHPGMSSMKRRLRQKTWWPKMDDQCEKYVKKCNACTLVSSLGPPEPMLRTKMPEKAWTDVAVDFLGPLPTGHNLLVIVDYYSRFVEVVVMRKITAELTIEALFETFTRFGVPEVLRSDNGPQFISETFKSFCKEFGIVQQKTTPYWPQANGEVERMNSSILKRLRISQETNQDGWKWDLRNFLLMYNSTPHSTTGIAPSALMFGRVLRDKLPSVQQSSGQLAEGIQDKDWERKLKQADSTDKRRRVTPNELDVGDIVVAKRMTKDHKLSSNFDPEQFEIISRKGTDVQLRSLDTRKLYHRNVSHLKLITRTTDSAEGSQARENVITNPEEAAPSQEEPVQRPQRMSRAPGYLRDYVAVIETDIK